MVNNIMLGGCQVICFYFIRDNSYSKELGKKILYVLNIKHLYKYNPITYDIIEEIIIIISINVKVILLVIFIININRFKYLYYLKNIHLLINIISIIIV